MPSFDIYALDSLEPGQDEADTAFDRYRRALIDEFRTSPEGQTYVAKHGSTGFWAGCMLDFGFNYIGVTLPNMTVSDLQEVVTDYFPRKVSLRSPEEAEDTIPELTAFWRFLSREFALPTAGAALRFLDEIHPSFVRIMNDPSRFGMAKSFFTAGQAAGFDMTDKGQMNMFAAAYNARVASDVEDTPSASRTRSDFAEEDPRVKRNRARSLRKRIAGRSKKRPGRKRR